MPTQQPEVDDPPGPDMTTDSRTPQPDRLPEPPLRVFISYKKKDHTATDTIKQILLRFGASSIKVFVSGDEQAGIQWRENVLKELREAHILIFLYTDPESRWDWCLYETGYFDARQDPEELNRRLYVLHGREDPPSGPFLGLNTVPIDASDGGNDKELTDFLKTLFERSTSPAVNPNWDAGGCIDLVTAFAAPFRRHEEVAPPQEYVRKLTFRLAKGVGNGGRPECGSHPCGRGGQRKREVVRAIRVRYRGHQELEQAGGEVASPDPDGPRGKHEP